MKPTKLKLVHVDTVNFSSTDANNIEASLRAARLKMGPGECALLFSVMGNQCAFVRTPKDVELSPGERNTLYVSTRFNLRNAAKDHYGERGSSWEENLAEFFTECEAHGMEITGIRSRVYDYFVSLGKIEEHKVRSVG